MGLVSIKAETASNPAKTRQTEKPSMNLTTFHLRKRPSSYTLSGGVQPAHLIKNLPAQCQEILLLHPLEAGFRNQERKFPFQLLSKFAVQPDSRAHPCAMTAVNFDISFIFKRGIGLVDCHRIDADVLCKQEAETLAEEEAEETKTVKTADAPAVEAPVVETASATEASAAPSALKGKDLRVLVLCAGAGTSALLANALKEGADELGIDITANAGAYGSHYAIMDQYNVIVLAPKVLTFFNEMKADSDCLAITLLSLMGKQYIYLTKDPKGAVAWIEENLEA